MSETEPGKGGDATKTTETGSQPASTAPPTVARPEQPRKSRSAAGLAILNAGLIVAIFGSATLFWPAWPQWLPWMHSHSVQPGQTEAVFVERAETEARDSVVLAEWRAARGAHRNIAFAIAQCDKLDDLEHMPLSDFSRLLLDLDPKGQHRFPPPSKSADETDSLDAQTKTNFTLVGLQPATLALSDEIARARLEAARAIDEANPGASWLSWIAVGLAGLTTLLISLKPVVEDQNSKSLTVIVTVVTLTVSAGSTTLNGVKSFYDPSQTYSANRDALVKLQNLHRQMALQLAMEYLPAKCAPPDPTQQASVKTAPGEADQAAPKQAELVAWAEQLEQIEVSITQTTVAPSPNGAKAAAVTLSTQLIPHMTETQSGDTQDNR